jgi:Glutathione S-transferase
MAAQTSGPKPTLWQIDISHFSEKARWALEYKGIDHVRRSPLPGVHMAVALWLTGGSYNTFPILELDGRPIGDSTAVIAALEETFPEPPLYPADPEQRRRALELEDFFDEELGPHMRLLAFHELIAEPELFAEVASQSVPGPLGKAKALTGAYARAYTSLRFCANSDDAAEVARAKIVAAMDRLDGELEANGGGYLVGEDFSVADLTAASLFFPLVGPEEGPIPPDTPSPPAFERFRDGLSDRPGYLWVEEMFRRHRKPARPAAAGASL